MIDLRSDTITLPSKEMLKEMSKAELGDDVFGEDKTTNELQEYIADMFGKESALFISSGTMGNQLGIKVNTSAGDEIIVESQSHIFIYETAAPSIISRVQLFPVDSEKGMMSIDNIEQAIRPEVYYFPKTSMVAVENTHNKHSGTIISLDYINKLSILAKKHKLKMHLDGARLWNAIAATNVPAKKWVENFDTITVCFSKGLGAPVGSILIASKKDIEKARKWRKILGGGMRQTGVLAAAALYAVKNNLSRIAEDNANARIFAEKIAIADEINVNLDMVETNIVYFDLPTAQRYVEFMKKCRDRGLLLISTGEKTARAVFHLHISATDARKAAAVVLDSVK